MYRIVFVRHGESQYNILKKYAGWLDCDLTMDGIEQAWKAGILLKEKGFSFDMAYTSLLKRANETLRYLLEEMGQDDIAVFRSWRLNERHYGAFDDLTREEVELKFGEAILRECKENFYSCPPVSENIRNYQFGGQVGDILLPKSESMDNVTTRCLLYWNSVIAPTLAADKTVLVVAHGELLRLLTGYLLEMGEEEIIRTPVIPNAAPVVFDLRDDFSVAGHYLVTEDKPEPSISGISTLS